MAPLGDFKSYPERPKMFGTAPAPFYNYRFALALATLRFKEMSRVADQGREDLKEMELIEKNSAKKALKPSIFSAWLRLRERGGNSVMIF